MPDSPRVAVVTGGCGGMGRAIAVRLAEAGCPVVAFDVRDTPEAATLRTGRDIEFVAVDVSDRAAVESAIGQVGLPRILVNAAGVLSRAPFLDLTDADWQRVMDVNLRGTFVCGQIVARRLVRAGQPGKIVNISSNSQVMATPQAAHYAASKGGVASLTRTMALELARHRINVNLVCPGPVLTDMNREAFADPAFRAAREATIPWGRLGEPSDIANAVAFLTSAESDFLTGAALFVDGGQTLTVA